MQCLGGYVGLFFLFFDGILVKWDKRDNFELRDDKDTLKNKHHNGTKIEMGRTCGHGRGR